MSKCKAKDTSSTIHTTLTNTSIGFSSVCILLGGKKFGNHGLWFPSAYPVQSPNFLRNWEEWNRILEDLFDTAFETQSTNHFQQAFRRGHPNTLSNSKQTAHALNSSAWRTLDAVQRLKNENMQNLCTSLLFFSECQVTWHGTAGINHRSKTRFKELEECYF